MTLAAAALAPLLADAACNRVEPGKLWNYEGTVGGKYRVRMTLVFQDGGRLGGVYYYASQLRDIRLRGAVTGGKDVTLEELDSSGNVTARFIGTFPERDPGTRYGDSPLECEVIVATWRKADDTAGPGLPVYLFSESATSGSLQHRYGAIGVADDEVVHRRSQAFWKAVKAGDRATVAGLVQYPIFVQVDGRRTRLADPAALLAVYDKVFTPAFRDAIARGLPRNMFVRDEGAMLGDGQVWFGASGKVIALNN